MGLALQELLRLPALSRARVLGGDLARQVSWVHVVDLPEPAPWVRPGQLVLTTGYAWPRDAGRLEAFAHTLAEREPAGVALAVPQFFEHFPPVALEVLAGKGVAVLELPWEIPFAQVTEEVLRRLLARQLEVGERVHLLHRVLMQAVLGREELETLLERLSQLLGRPVRYADAPVGFSVPVPLGRERGGYLVLEGEADEVERQALENAALVAGLIVAQARFGGAGGQAGLRLPGCPPGGLARGHDLGAGASLRPGPGRALPAWGVGAAPFPAFERAGFPGKGKGFVKGTGPSEATGSLCPLVLEPEPGALFVAGAPGSPGVP